MRQLDRQLLVLQYLHDNCLEESEVDIVFEPTGGLSHTFKNKKESLTVTEADPVAPIVDAQITDSVTSVNTHEESDESRALVESTKSETDASKKKRPPPPKKKSQ